MCLLVRGHSLRGVPLAVFLLLFWVNTHWGRMPSPFTLDGQMVLLQVRVPRTIGLLEGIEPDDSKNFANVGMRTDLVEGTEGVRSALGAPRDYGGARTARATAGEGEGIIGSSHDVVTRFSSVHSSGAPSHACVSYLDALLAAPARAPAAFSLACRTARTSAVVDLCMHGDGTSMHGVRNSGGTGGLLPVHRSTSYCLNNSCSDTGRVKGPHGHKEGQRWSFQSGRRFSSCLRGGGRGKFSAGWRTGAGCFPRGQPGTGTRRVRECVVTPSLHPEVPGVQFVSPGYGLDIKQSMGWTKVCGTAQSGILVLKGNARTSMFPEYLDHLRVRWISRGTYETARVTPGHDCLCSY